MPDPVVPIETPVAAPAPPVAATPPPQPSPAQPAGQPAGSSSDDLKPDTVIEYTGKDGSKRYATIRDLVNRAESEGAQIPADELERLRTVERGLSGDQDAARKMLEMFVPGLQPNQQPQVPADPVQQKLAELESMVKPTKALFDRIEEERLVSGCTGFVDAHKDKVPYLAKHPDAGRIVYSRIEAAKANYRAAGQDPDRLPNEQQIRIIADAMRTANAELQTLATMFGAPPLTPAQQKQAQSVQANNDQNQPGVQPGVIPARLRVDPATGMIVDQRGAVVGQSPYGAMVPTDIPSPAAAGAPVAGTVPVAKQMMTREQMMNIMRARAAEMNAQ